MAEIFLSDSKKNALAQVGDISFAAAAATLSHLLNRRVLITAPQVSVSNLASIKAGFPAPYMVALVSFTEGFQGEQMLMFKKEDALLMVGLMMGMEPPAKPEQMGELELSALGEAVNQMMGSQAAALTDYFNFKISLTTPSLKKVEAQEEETEISGIWHKEPAVQLTFRLEIENALLSEMVQVFSLEQAEQMIRHLQEDRADRKEKDTSVKEDQPTITPEQTGAEEAGEHQEKSAPDEDKKPALFSAEVKDKSGFAPAETAGEKSIAVDYDKLSFIKDIPIKLHVVLGRARINLKELSTYGPGVVVALDRYAGEPVELYANNKLVARGEVVLVNGYFGLKITSMRRR